MGDEITVQAADSVHKLRVFKIREINLKRDNERVLLMIDCKLVPEKSTEFKEHEVVYEYKVGEIIY